MDRAEADELKAWFAAYSRTVRMEYGIAMLELFDPEVVERVQQRVAKRMLEWMDRTE